MSTTLNSAVFTSFPRLSCTEYSPTSSSLAPFVVTALVDELYEYLDVSVISLESSFSLEISEDDILLESANVDGDSTIFSPNSNFLSART